MISALLWLTMAASNQPFGEAARDAYRAGQVARTTAERRQHHQRGLALAQQALARDPDDPAGLLWYAANLGAEALLRGKLRALPVVGDIERVLLHLERVHPGYDDAAAARSLGRLYHQAPPLISVGSSRKAADYLTRALSRAPDNAGNLAYGADFFSDQGDCARARSLLQQLQRHAALRQTGPEGDEFRDIARAVAKRCR
jgi:tetratricopeptide (TPR) repeat protein